MVQSGRWAYRGMPEQDARDLPTAVSLYWRRVMGQEVSAIEGLRKGFMSLDQLLKTEDLRFAQAKWERDSATETPSNDVPLQDERSRAPGRSRRSSLPYRSNPLLSYDLTAIGALCERFSEWEGALACYQAAEIIDGDPQPQRIYLLNRLGKRAEARKQLARYLRDLRLHPDRTGLFGARFLNGLVLSWALSSNPRVKFLYKGFLTGTEVEWQQSTRDLFESVGLGRDPVPARTARGLEAEFGPERAKEFLHWLNGAYPGTDFPSDCLEALEKFLSNNDVS